MANDTYPVHYPTRDLLRRLGLLKQGFTNFTIPAVTLTPGNMQSRYVPWEPHQ